MNGNIATSMLDVSVIIAKDTLLMSKILSDSFHSFFSTSGTRLINIILRRGIYIPKGKNITTNMLDILILVT